LPVALYGCETWYPILREEHRLKVYKNMVLRRLSGPKRVDKRLEKNEERHNLYSSPNIVIKIKSRMIR
jgi:hypothetical protein